jgi:hypothetical protein
MPWRVVVLMSGASTVRIAWVGKKSGQSIFESLQTIRIVVVFGVAAAGSASLALDSAPPTP